MIDAIRGTSKSPRESIGKAFELAQVVLAMDNSDPQALNLLGNVYANKGEYEKAIAEFEKAIAIDPSYPYSYMNLAFSLTSEGRPQESIPLLKKSMRLTPLYQDHASRCLYRLGRAYRTMGQYDEALSALKKAQNIRPNVYSIHLELAATYIHLGREEEAREAVAEARRLFPKISLEGSARYMAYKNQADQERYVEALRKAGLK